MKCQIITLLKSFAGPVNGQILWNTDDADACDAIRQENGSEFLPSTLNNIHSLFKNLHLTQKAIAAYNLFTNSRLDSLPLESYKQLRAQDLPLDDLDSIHHLSFGRPLLLKNKLPLLTNQINLERNPGE